MRVILKHREYLFCPLFLWKIVKRQKWLLLSQKHFQRTKMATFFQNWTRNSREKNLRRSGKGVLHPGHLRWNDVPFGVLFFGPFIPPYLCYDLRWLVWRRPSESIPIRWWEPSGPAVLFVLLIYSIRKLNFEIWKEKNMSATKS